MAKMHADEFEIDVALVRRLLAKQFAVWAELPLKAVPSARREYGRAASTHWMGCKWR